MKQNRKYFLLLFSLFTFFVQSVSCQNTYRDQELQPEKVMDAIGIRKGMVIGEGGAGRGYFTFKMSNRVGITGKIYANDIDKDVLQVLYNQCERENIKNIDTILGKVEDPLFPKKELDMVIMVQAFHDFEKPVEWLENAKSSLKPGATLVIIDKDPEKWNQGWDHFMTKSKILELTKKANYQLVKIETFLKKDNVYIFRVKNRDS